jgi:hypothetical protein
MLVISPWRDRSSYVSIMLATLKEAMRGHDDVHIRLYNNESKDPHQPSLGTSETS